MSNRIYNLLEKNVLPELKTVIGTHERVKHPSIDVGDSGVWASSMLEVWSSMSIAQKWRTYERLIIVKRTISGEDIPDKEYFEELRGKFGVIN